MVGMRDVSTSVTGNAIPMITMILAYSNDNDELNASLKYKHTINVQVIFSPGIIVGHTVSSGMAMEYLLSDSAISSS